MSNKSRKLNKTPLSQANLDRLPHNVYPCKATLNVCPLCGCALRQDYVFAVPISNFECVKVSGQCCHKCDAFFCSDTETLYELEIVRIRRELYQLNRCFDDYDSIEQERRFKLDSACYQITICKDFAMRVYTIVTKAADVSNGNNILHFKNDISLTLLTSLFLYESCSIIDDAEYVIVNIRSKRNENVQFISPNQCVEVGLKRNGGYFDPSQEFVPIMGLVFCEKSRRLEVIPMSYDKEFAAYFVDKQIYDNFCLRFGIPIVRYANRSKCNWGELREESLLHQLGYNVNAYEGLSRKQRQDRLASVVDMDFMKVHTIVALLDSLINRNRSRNHLACEKWEDDKKFIQSYKVDPERIEFISRIRSLS